MHRYISIFKKKYSNCHLKFIQSYNIEVDITGFVNFFLRDTNTRTLQSFADKTKKRLYH